MNSLVSYYLKLINSDIKSPLSSLLLGGLYLFSFVYIFMVKIIRFWESRHQFVSEIPIISVGNITWGGSGKTPLVITIAQYFEKRGVKVAVVHRGKYYEDEIQMLRNNLKHTLIFSTHSKRKTVKNIVDNELAEIIILDDGFQQWGLAKNLDIVCLNYNAILGNSYFIPRGNLREEPGSLKRADLILVNKSRDLARKEEVIKTIREYTDAEVVFTRYKPIQILNLRKEREKSLEDLKNIPAALLTAVAEPDSVRYVLSHMGLVIMQEFIYPDHYNFSSQDLLQIKKVLNKNVRAFFITEKDYVKIKSQLESWQKVLNVEFLLLKITLEFLENEKALYRRLDILLAGSGF